MNMLKILILVGALTIASLPVGAKDDSYEKQKSCIDLTNQSSAAMVAEDWERLVQLAERYLKTCKNVFGDEDYSMAYRNMALANVMLGNAKKAVQISDTCIRLYYSNSGCHIWRVEALIALNRMNEAKTSLDKTEKLIRHLTETKRGELRYANEGIDIELINAKLNELTAQQRQAESIRNRYFGDR